MPDDIRIPVRVSNTPNALRDATGAHIDIELMLAWRRLQAAASMIDAAEEGADEAEGARAYREFDAAREGLHALSVTSTVRIAAKLRMILSQICELPAAEDFFILGSAPAPALFSSRWEEMLAELILDIERRPAADLG